MQNNSKNNNTDRSSTTFKQGSEQKAFARNQFEAIFDRIKKALQVESETGLGRKLGIKQSSVAGARKRNQIPPGWIVKISEQYEISADWLLFGEGIMSRDEKTKKARALSISQRDDLARTIVKLGSNMELLHGLTYSKEIPLDNEGKDRLLSLIGNDVLENIRSSIIDAMCEMTDLIPSFEIVEENPKENKNKP